MTKILIADDHPVVLEGLYNHLNTNESFQVFKATDGAESLKFISEEKPEIAILDIEMPHMDGLSIAQHCLSNNIETKFIILSYHKEAEFLVKAKKLNVSGYILKEDSLSEIEECIACILKGESYFSKVFLEPSITEVFDAQEKVKMLTPSERKILKLILQKNSSKDIASKLFISERTVEKHRSNIIQKLEISSSKSTLYEWLLENKIEL